MATKMRDLELIATQPVETDEIDFKETFDRHNQRDWCELLKDVVAIGNHGGGAIVIGVRDDGVAVGVSDDTRVKLDSAEIGDQIRRHTGRHDPRCIVRSAVRDGKAVVVIEVQSTAVPIIFSKNGTYEIGGKQKSSFVEGKVYFRHNSKSEPGSTEDLERAITREVARHRHEWLGNIRKVVEAPIGSKVSVSAPGVMEPDPNGSLGVRLVNAGAAIDVPKWDPDKTHPFRQKELISEVMRGLEGKYRLNSFDIQCIRRVYRIDENPNFAHKSRFSMRQYSPAFAEWIVSEAQSNERFFIETRERARLQT
jgi:hypothetical protein